jgi:hypothetical protein
MRETDSSPAGAGRSAPREGAAWLAGFAATALPVASALWLRASDHSATPVWIAEQVIGLAAVVVLLLGARAPGARRCAAAAGAAAGVLVGVALAQRTPTAWFMKDVAWHCAKVAVAARGSPLDDPILRTPTIYPFLFSALVGAPVALGLPVRAAMWAVTPLSLAAGLAAYHRLARAFLRPAPAAWTAAAFPLVVYVPLSGYWLLPNPFNLSVAFVFGGLALLARGTPAGPATPATPAIDGGRRLAAAGACLGTAGLLWYAHLLWIVPGTLIWALGRWRAFLRVALGALAPALVLALHAGLLWRAGHLGAAGITGRDPPGSVLERLLALGRNLMSLSGGYALSEVATGWIGPLVGLLLALALVRRERADGPPRVLASFAPAFLPALLWAGMKLTFWQEFSWRYAFLLYALALVAVGAARPWRIAGRELGPIAIAGVAGILCGPLWMRLLVEASLSWNERYEREVRPVAAFLERHTSFDEPVFASTETWEAWIAISAPRPTLVDRLGGVFKYAPAKVAGPRWRLLQEIQGMQDAAEIAARLAPYGFRYALIADGDRAQPGFAALAEGFETALESGRAVLVDLTRPR